MAIVVGPTQWQYLICNPPPPELGDAFEGGYVICCSGGIRWIVAPSSTEVKRCWWYKSDAVTTAEANASCGDWFIPTCGQLKNPGYTCRTYWDSYCSGDYWSNTNISTNGYYTDFNTGSTWPGSRNAERYVRTFRCVTY